MTLSNGGDRLVPDFRILVDGTQLPPEAAGDVVMVDVLDDIDAPSMFALRLINWDIAQLKVTWADDGLFAEGREVTVEMGYQGGLEPLIVGEVTGLEPEFIADEVPQLVVRGHDRRHRLMRGRKTRSFTTQKDSDVASRLAHEAGLIASVEDTGLTLDYVLQHNQTDLEFLQSRARRIGYEVVVDAKTLHFRPHQHDQSEALALSRDVDLQEFRPRLSAFGLVGQISVQGWSPKDKAAIVGTAAQGGVATRMGGNTLGIQVADRSFGAESDRLVDQPVFGPAEADAEARGHLEDLALAYVTGEGICVGRPDLRAGLVARIDGVGNRFSGLYYVTSTNHRYSPERGYRTHFAVRRNST